MTRFISMLLLLFMFLCINCKYNSTPAYTVKWQSEFAGTPRYMLLSGDSQRIGLWTNLDSSYDKFLIFKFSDYV